jgi:hypothetical protein
MITLLMAFLFMSPYYFNITGIKRMLSKIKHGKKFSLMLSWLDFFLQFLSFIKYL